MKVYEDNELVAELSLTPAAAGHTIIKPKKKYTILEQLPPELAGKMFTLANKLSAILFDAIGAQGTNTIMQNGIPAGQKDPLVSLHVIPRKEDDQLQFTWEPKAAEEEALVAVEEKLKEALTEKKEIASPEEAEKERKQKVAWLEKQMLRKP